MAKRVTRKPSKAMIRRFTRRASTLNEQLGESMFIDPVSGALIEVSHPDVRPKREGLKRRGRP
jgi:hypothetical protein